jgi:hypothetical protein
MMPCRLLSSLPAASFHPKQLAAKVFSLFRVADRKRPVELQSELDLLGR